MVSQEELVHVTCECLKTKAPRFHSMNCVPLIIQQDEFDVQHEFDSLTLRLIRDPLEPTFHTETELQRFRVSYSYIVRCLQTFFSDFFL